MQRLFALITASLVAAAALGGEPSEGARCSTVPERPAVEPARRGTGYKAPGMSPKESPVWGWSCEVPGGPALSCGWLDTRAEDGRAHTRVKDAAEWKRIDAELREKNPLQKRCAALWAVREKYKDLIARARHVYLEGGTEDAEKKALAEQVNPAMEKLAAELAALVKELEALQAPGEYEAGQVRFALERVKAAAGEVRPVGARVTHELLAAMRQAQVQLELAAEALDAEPPARALSRIAYDPKTKLFVIFGGEHFDYLTNDLWVFDPAKRRWLQRHPDGAPEPRADQLFEPAGDGKVKLRGGFSYSNQTGYGSNQYMHVGPEEWVYDVEKNTWTGEGQKLPADSRVYRKEPYLPEHYTKGQRPDAAVQEARLKALPVNTWVELKPPAMFPRCRDWGTVAYDPDRDMVYMYCGGHCVYTACDVLHYHLATGRWEQPVPTEEPLGMIGASGVSVPGVSFNRRPWMTNHTWNCYEYHPGLKKMIVAGRLTAWSQPQPDPYFYLYDPERAEWVSRHPTGGLVNDRMSVQLCWTPKGMLAWNNGLWLLDAEKLEWKALKFTGPLPGPTVDSAGLIYDDRRDRVLFFATGYGKPYSGTIQVLDMKTNQVSATTPAGSDKIAALAAGKGDAWYLREVVHDPESGLFLWNSRIGGGLLPAYDPAKETWAAVKIAGGASIGHAVGMIYDTKRKLIWTFDGHNGGMVWALRFDAKQAEVKPLGELGAPPAAEKK